MFTVEQIMAARAKIRSGDDFPVFIQEMIDLGIVGFETFPADGHSEYFGHDGFHLATKRAYPSLPISSTVNKSKFEYDLQSYLTGDMSYPDFCEQATGSGIKKWKANFDIMTCVYVDLHDETVMIQSIP